MHDFKISNMNSYIPFNFLNQNILPKNSILILETGEKFFGYSFGYPGDRMIQTPLFMDVVNWQFSVRILTSGSSSRSTTDAVVITSVVSGCAVVVGSSAAESILYFIRNPLLFVDASEINSMIVVPSDSIVVIDSSSPKIKIYSFIPSANQRSISGINLKVYLTYIFCDTGDSRLDLNQIIMLLDIVL